MVSHVDGHGHAFYTVLELYLHELLDIIIGSIGSIGSITNYYLSLCVVPLTMFY